MKDTSFLGVIEHGFSEGLTGWLTVVERFQKVVTWLFQKYVESLLSDSEQRLVSPLPWFLQVLLSFKGCGRELMNDPGSLDDALLFELIIITYSEALLGLSRLVLRV